MSAINPPTTTGEEQPASRVREQDRYAFLSQRAVAFVHGKGGSAHEDLLIAHVFGNTGSTALWGPLLRSVLGRGDGLTRRDDGYWTLAEVVAPPDSPLLAEFVVLDVETTGLKPLHQRIIELAAIRYRDGTEVERFETLCNPDKRIPRYISDLTGITDAHVADAPRFSEVAEEVMAFLGSSLIVGHNVGFDISFVNAELKRLGKPPLINERVDTLGLATRVLSKIRKPSLDNVALAVGLNPRHVHRAGGDAQLTAQVALRLAEAARAQGKASLGEIKALAGSATRRPRDGVGRGRAVLDRSLLTGIPKLPGVYLMRDEHDHVIYVGKAKNLRDRVASYYSQPLGYTRKMDGLLETMTRVDYEVVGSELEALLLEAQLIKWYQPRYNTALRAFEHYPFIRVDVANPWPRVTLAKARKEDGARYFGPFRNKSGARKTVDLINAIVPLRTCSRSFKDARSYGSPCIQLDLGNCLGPCAGRASRDDYMGLVREVVQFLDGREEVFYERLWRGLEDAAARLDFERADRLRREIQQIGQVVGAHKQLREAAETHTLLLVLPSADPAAREVLLVAAGRLWAQLRADRSDGVSDLAARLERSWERFQRHGNRPLDHDTVDDANILNRWLYRNAGHPAILPLPPPQDGLSWHDFARRALALRDRELMSEVALGGDDDVAGELGDAAMPIAADPSTPSVPPEFAPAQSGPSLSAF